MLERPELKSKNAVDKVKKVSGPLQVVPILALTLGGLRVGENPQKEIPDNLAEQTKSARIIDKPGTELPLLNRTSQVLRDVCIDPAGDEHPATVDILKVRAGETSTHRVFEFNLADSVLTKRSKLRPDIGLGGGLVESDGKTRILFHAQGAEKSQDIVVRVIKLENPVEIEQGPAIPLNNQEKTLLWVGGEGFIETGSTGRIVTVKTPKEQFDGTSKKIKFFTTEGEDHGNEPLQTINKDVCEEVLVIPTSTLTATPTLKPTATRIPTPKPTETQVHVIKPKRTAASTTKPTKTATPVPSPTAERITPKALPLTGAGPGERQSKTTENLLALAGGGLVAGVLGMLDHFRRKRARGQTSKN